MPATLDAALSWAERGFFVFPLHPGTKVPVHNAWYDVATNDPDVIRALWGDTPYNIGVHAKDHIIVDIDCKNGVDGSLAFFDLGYDSDTLTVRTPTGGLHLYYKGPAVQNSAGKLGEGLDVRSFHGYVIAPGSVTEDGEYTIAHEAMIRDAPVDLIERAGAPRPDREIKTAVATDQAAALLQAVRYLQDTPIGIAGSRNDTAFKTAAHLKDMGLSFPNATAVMAEHWNPRCQPPLEFDELKKTIENAFVYGSKIPGENAPNAEFEGVQIPPVENGAPARVWYDHGADFRGGVSWLYHSLLPACGVAVLTAPSSAGKTFLALHLARSLATGEPFFDTLPEDKGGTIILTAEGQGSIRFRMAALDAPEPLPLSAGPLEYLGEKGALARLQIDLQAKAYAMFLLHQVPVRLVVLDTLSASGLIDDENDNAKASMALRALDKLAANLNVLILVLHHPPKKGDGVGGAGAIRNRSDYVLEARMAHGEIRELELIKSRDSQQRKLGSFTLIPKSLGLDERGRPITSCVISTGPVLAPPERRPAHTESVMAILEALAVSAPDGSPEHEVRDLFVASMQGKKNAPALLKTCLDWMERQGLVEMVAISGTPYIRSTVIGF